jgi:hypothetical protein
MSYGKTVKLFLADGSASGIRHAEIANWTGQAIAAPRTRYSELKTWDETLRSGVYLLFGYSEDTGSERVYVGESENVFTRIGDHVRNKDFWRECVAFTSKDQNLTKAHVKYLESRILEIASDTGRFKLDNSDKPSLPSLPKADVAAMEEYIDLIRITLGALGYPVIEPLVVRQQTTPKSTAGVVETDDPGLFSFEGAAFSAQGVLGDEGFIVLAGAKISRDAAPSTPKHVQGLRDAAVADSTLIEKDGNLTLGVNTLFKSPSAAACFVSGSSRNGKWVWRDSSGRSIGDLEADQATIAENDISNDPVSGQLEAVQHPDSEGG